MSAITINGPDELKAKVGEEIGVSDWYAIPQAEIDKFADVTKDFQFIHVDPEKAAGTPFGGTIAHGLFTLSLGPKFSYELLSLEGFAFGVNYGYEKIRFPSPVPVDSKLRMRMTIKSVDEVPGGLQYVMTQTFEVEGGSKPVCVAEQVVRVFTG